jgi:hypothetical protein
MSGAQVCRWVACLWALSTAVGCSAALASGAARSHSAPLVVPSLEREIRSVSVAMRGAGWQPAGPALAGFMLSGNHATLPIQVPVGKCVTIASRATHGARDVDAALYSADGTLLALDSEPDAHPTVQACASQTEIRAYYVIQFYEGDGSFVAVPYFGVRASIQRAATALGGRPAFAEIVAAPEVAEDPIAAFSEGLHKRGYVAVGEPRRFAISEGERVRENLPVELGQCYTVAVFGGKGIDALGVRLLDERGVERSASSDGQAQAATQLCVRENAVYGLESAAQSGGGDVLVLIFRVDVVTAGGDAGLWLGHRAVVASDSRP